MKDVQLNRTTAAIDLVSTKCDVGFYITDNGVIFHIIFCYKAMIVRIAEEGRKTKTRIIAPIELERKMKFGRPIRIPRITLVKSVTNIRQVQHSIFKETGKVYMLIWNHSVSRKSGMWV